MAEPGARTARLASRSRGPPGAVLIVTGRGALRLLVIVAVLAVLEGERSFGFVALTASGVDHARDTPTPSQPHAGAPSASPPSASPVPAFAEEGDGPLNPRWSAFYARNDPGFDVDADFMSDLSRVAVASGAVTLTAERARTPSGRPYASAMIATRTTFAQAFGTWEARIRFPEGQGVWPGFFLLPQGQAAPYPEIDIFEAYPAAPGRGGMGTSVIVSTVHVAPGVARHIAFDTGLDLTADFHVYRMTWSATTLEFSFDGRVYWTVTRDIPKVPMYPVLDLAMGAPGYRVDDTTPPVVRMDIDYLRVFAP